MRRGTPAVNATAKPLNFQSFLHRLLGPDYFNRGAASNDRGRIQLKFSLLAQLAAQLESQKEQQTRLLTDAKRVWACSMPPVVEMARATNATERHQMLAVAHECLRQIDSVFMRQLSNGDKEGIGKRLIVDPWLCDASVLTRVSEYATCPFGRECKFYLDCYRLSHSMCDAA